LERITKAKPINKKINVEIFLFFREIMKGNEKKNNLDMTDPAIYSSLKIPLSPNPWFVDDGEPNIDPL
tara:strand:- start:603 stop:806 length:204 start_codon:yes stop_codon:yes gene_type:complete